MNEITQIRKLSLWIFFTPFIAINLCLFISQNPEFLENTFFIVVYSIIGSSFLNYYYIDAFELYINGNGGFVGNYINQLFLGNIISINENIFYYSLINSIMQELHRRIEFLLLQ